MKTVYYNGKVYTGTLPLAEAFVTDGDRFLFAGSNEEARAVYGRDAELVDLEGRFVCSGFNDSHMHLLNYGQALSTAPLSEHTKSLADMLHCLKMFQESHPVADGSWLIGRGWNQDYFSDVERMPNRYDLDQVSKKIPVLAVRACGHCLVVNSKGLEILGIHGKPPQPEGGRIGMENGEPDGRFFDNAMGLVYAAIPAPNKERVKELILLSCKSLNTYGVTSSQTDDYCVFQNLPWQVINEAYEELKAEGRLTVRIYQQANFTSLPELAEFVEEGNVTGAGDPYFKIGPLKMLGDGALGARTAYLSRPYADDPSTCGLPVFDQETLDQMIGYANDHNMQVAVHTIGDRILDQVLDAYGKALKNHPRQDHRHGIVHCQITRPDQLKRIAEMKLHVYAQSIFLDYDTHIVEARVGRELASSSYSWKTLMELGVSVSNGTDCPVERPDALAGIQCAVTRASLKGEGKPYLPEQAFTVQEALDSYTIRGAEASFEEQIKGQIRAGMLADFVILNENPFEAEPHCIKDIPVCATFLGGKKVFG